MKLAVGLFGIHYCEKLNHWCDWTQSVDYRIAIQSQQNNLYDLLNADSIDFYSATYNSELIDQLREHFKFKLLRVRTLNNTKPVDKEMFVRRNSIFRSTVDTILTAKQDYDYVLITRYDFFPKTPFNKFSYNLDKVNLVCKAKWGERHSLCDDNFYYMPYKLLPDFRKRIFEIPLTETSHAWNSYMSDIFHYLDENAYYSHELPHYTILRTNLRRILT